MKKISLFLGLCLGIAQLSFGQGNIQPKNNLKTNIQLGINALAHSNDLQLDAAGKSYVKNLIINNIQSYFVKEAKVEVALKKEKGKWLIKVLPLKKALKNISKNTTYKITEIELITIPLSDIKLDANNPLRYYFDYQFIERRHGYQGKGEYDYYDYDDTANLQEVKWDYIDDTTKKGRVYIEKNKDFIGTEKQIVKVISIRVVDASLKK